MKLPLAIDGSPCSDAVIAEVARWPCPPQTEIPVVTADAPIGPVTVVAEIAEQQRPKPRVGPGLNRASARREGSGCEGDQNRNLLRKQATVMVRAGCTKCYGFY